MRYLLGLPTEKTMPHDAIPEFAAFMSYARVNNRHDDDRLAELRAYLEGEVQTYTGEPFTIFWDQRDISWGQNWQRRIVESIDNVTFFIPILTPSFFKSRACRQEMEQFLQREQRLGRDDLILPIYYVELSDPGLDQAAQNDQLLKAVAARNCVDWRELRFEQLTSPPCRLALRKMAMQIRDVLKQRPIPSERPSSTTQKQEMLPNIAGWAEESAMQYRMVQPWTEESEVGDAGAGSQIQRLVVALMSHDVEISRRAAAALCEYPDPAGWEALVANAKGWDPEVVRLQAQALSKLCLKADVLAIRDEKVAREVIDELAAMRGERAVEVLRQCLGHVSPSVRSRALTALESRGVAAADDEERRRRALVHEDFKALKRLGPGAIPELLIAQLGDEDRFHRVEAVEALSQIGDVQAVETLIEALKDPEDNVRSAAATALAELADPRAVEPLILLLKDSDDWVRHQAAAALGKLRDAQAVQPLAEALEDLYKFVRQSAAHALAGIGSAEAVPALGRALADTDVEVRRIAAAGLAGIGGIQAGRLLEAAMSDPDDEVRSSAARGLSKERGQAGDEVEMEAALVSGLHSPGRSARSAAAEALKARGWQPVDDEQRAFLLVGTEDAMTPRKYGEAAVDALCLALLDGGHYYLSETAAESLGFILDVRAVRALCRALEENTNLTVRAAAATALGRIRDRSAAGPLAAALKKELDQWVRPFIAAALEKVSDTSEPDRLVAALSDDHSDVRLRAAVLLARRGDPRGVAWMERTALEVKHEVLPLRNAILALRDLGTPAAIAALINVIRADRTGRDDAVDALVHIGERAVRPAVAALAQMQHNGRWSTLIGLAKLGPPAMTALCASLPTAERELKRIACDVLGRMFDREDVPHKPTEPLILLLGDDDPEVRGHAAYGLKLLKWEPASVAERELLNRAKES